MSQVSLWEKCSGQRKLPCCENRLVDLRDSQGKGSEKSQGLDCCQVVHFTVQLGKLRPREPQVGYSPLAWSLCHLSPLLPGLLGWGRGRERKGLLPTPPAEGPRPRRA